MSYVSSQAGCGQVCAGTQYECGWSVPTLRACALKAVCGQVSMHSHIHAEFYMILGTHRPTHQTSFPSRQAFATSLCFLCEHSHVLPVVAHSLSPLNTLGLNLAHIMAVCTDPVARVKMLKTKDRQRPKPDTVRGDKLISIAHNDQEAGYFASESFFVSSYLFFRPCGTW